MNKRCGPCGTRIPADESLPGGASWNSPDHRKLTYLARVFSWERRKESPFPKPGVCPSSMGPRSVNRGERPHSAWGNYGSGFRSPRVRSMPQEMEPGPTQQQRQPHQRPLRQRRHRRWRGDVYQQLHIVDANYLGLLVLHRIEDRESHRLASACRDIKAARRLALQGDIRGKHSGHDGRPNQGGEGDGNRWQLYMRGYRYFQRLPRRYRR